MRNITETEINKADIKALFKNASELRSKPTGLGRVFKSLRKDAIDVSDLQQAWAEAGYPDDTQDIGAILVAHGFKDKEIDKVFSNVFGEGEGDYEEPTQSSAIQKIADYAKKTGIDQEILKFLQQEYNLNESRYSGKAVVEDIRQIFTRIVQEERLARHDLIRTHEQTQLGRPKK
jgi:hypothetical protein